MNTAINEKISVVTIFDHQNGSVMPRKIKWRGQTYFINLLGYHHKVKQGKTLMHIFSVANQNLAFRLRFDSDLLHWTLEEVSDGLAD